MIVVTRGAVDKLSRDELQGVIGHEFSHILNGDMALNLRLAALLAGLTWLGDRAEALFFASAAGPAGGGRGGQSGGRSPPSSPRRWRSSAFRAPLPQAQSRRRSRASASSSPTPRACSSRATPTRSPARSTRSSPFTRAPPCSPRTHRDSPHMFFAPAVGNWFGFATHPPIDERIRRVHPRFQREDYRARRHGRQAEVAVLDGAGNVVKNVRTAPAEVVASVGRPTRDHVDFSRRLLESLPPRAAPGIAQRCRKPSGCSCAGRDSRAEPGGRPRACEVQAACAAAARADARRARAAGDESAAATAARSVPRRNSRRWWSATRA